MALVLASPHTPPIRTCFTGDRHAPIGTFAALFIPLYVVGLGVFALLALLRDPMLLWQLAQRAARRTDKNASSATLRITVVSPIRVARCLEGRQPAPPPDDPILAPFLGEYIYAAWYFKHTDLCVLCVLASIQVC